jgi:hypothetical protein
MQFSCKLELSACSLLRLQYNDLDDSVWDIETPNFDQVDFNALNSLDKSASAAHCSLVPEALILMTTLVLLGKIYSVFPILEQLADASHKPVLSKPYASL